MSKRRRLYLKYGGVLIALHIPWALAVMYAIPKSDPLYLPLMAPAGLVANFFLPAWLVLLAYHWYVDERPGVVVDA